MAPHLVGVTARRKRDRGKRCVERGRTRRLILSRSLGSNRDHVPHDLSDNLAPPLTTFYLILDYFYCGKLLMYVITVEFAVKPASVTAFQSAMLKNAQASLASEPGCQQFDVCFSRDDLNACFLYEVYDDRAAFDAHLAMAHFKSFDAEVAPMLDGKVVKIFELVQDRVLK